MPNTHLAAGTTLLGMRVKSFQQDFLPRLQWWQHLTRLVRRWSTAALSLQPLAEVGNAPVMQTNLVI